MKSIFETLAALSTGAALLSGCGGAPTPVNAAEVPAAVEIKPSAQAPTEDKSAAAAAAGATTPTVPVAVNAAATPAAAGSAKAAAGPAAPPAKKKAAGAKKTGADASCGAGTCST
jgi:hypothetical protein